MLQNYLKITWRNLRKNRTYVIINVLGLGIALACCIVAYLNWEYNATYDGNHENAEEIYRVNFIRQMGGRDIANGSCPMPLALAIKQNVPQVSEAVRYLPSGANFKVETTVFSTGIAGVDPEFFDLFTFEFTQGSAQSIQDERTIVIDEELMARHWPEGGNIVGEFMTLVDGDQKFEFKIGGVFKEQPENSSMQQNCYLHYGAVLQIQNYEATNWSFFNSTFVRIQDPVQIETVTSQLQDYVTVQNQAKEDYKVARYYLDPFVGMAVRAEKEGIWNHWFSQSLPTAAASAPGIMSLLLLLIACFNFTNTSIATANRRLKEIGIRKVMGSAKRQIIAQFWGENLLLSFMALALGILIAAFLVPLYSSMWAFLEIKFNIFSNISLILFLAGLLFFTAIVAGSYPALYVSKFQPTDIFRSSLQFGGTNLLTRFLLTFQFSISLIAIICGFVFAKNATYQDTYDLGFNADTVVAAYVGSGEGYRKLRNAVKENPKVISVAGARNNIGNSWYTDPVKAEDKEIDVNVFDLGPDYLAAIGATVIKGRNFKADSDYDVYNAAIINEELANVMGWEDPIDQRFILKDTVQLQVIGMVKNIHQDGALWDPIEPMVIRGCGDDRFHYLVVKTALADVKDVKMFMDEQWKTLFPDELPRTFYMDEEKVESKEVNANIKYLFIFLAMVAALLSVIGLFSMVSMNINKRLKEIGVRKILGAPMRAITMGISREFIFILGAASILGIVGGYFLATMLMESIWTYYTPVTAAIFIFAVSSLILVCVITVGRIIYRAASVIPVHLLQD